MRTLKVSLEQQGRLVPVGELTGSGPESAQFRYCGDYLQSPSPAALSISLPLREAPFTPDETGSFFEGLLPEGFTRRTVAQWLHAEEGDYLSILHALGRECLGAICITEEGEKPPEAGYEPVSAGQIRLLAEEGATRSAELVTKSHLSLTGASGKVGLYYAEAEDAWYLPCGTAPSTHIVKQSHIRLDSIVANEQLSLMTAARCGIRIPYSFIINTGEGGEHEVLFATERYDRAVPAGAERIDGLPRPLRLHQEDLAQAMGIPASRKYEQGRSGYMKGMFDTLRRISADPIDDQLKLWDLIVFHVLIGNTDGHIKNFSLLYGPDLKTVRLAPAYDIVSTAVYEQSTRDLAFSIGGVYSLDDMDTEAFRRAAEEAGLGARMALRRLRQMTERFPAALEESANELVAKGYPNAAELRERILAAGGIRRFI